MWGMEIVKFSLLKLKSYQQIYSPNHCLVKGFFSYAMSSVSLILKTFLDISIHSLNLFVKTNKGRNQWFLCCNFSYTMVCLILFTIVAATLCYTLILLHIVSATVKTDLKLVLSVLCKTVICCCYTYFVCVQILFCRTSQVQKLQYKQTRDLSSSNRRRLLNKMFSCLQIYVESLKTLLMCVCVVQQFLTC